MSCPGKECHKKIHHPQPEFIRRYFKDEKDKEDTDSESC